MATINYMQEIQQEIARVPKDRLAGLVKVIHNYIDEDVAEMSIAQNSFKEGWKDVLLGKVHPVESLWDEVDNDHV